MEMRTGAAQGSCYQHELCISPESKIIEMRAMLVFDNS